MNRIKGLKLQPKLTLVDIAFSGFLIVASIGLAFWMGYNNAERHEANELRMSKLCEAQGWTPELRSICEDYDV